MSQIKFNPGEKAEWKRLAGKILKEEIPVSATDFPAIIEMLQDYNWPGTAELVQFINNNRLQAIPYLREALQSGDPLWNYWILTCVFEEASYQEVNSVKTELIHLAKTPDEEGACILALQILLKYSFIQTDEAKSLAKKFNPQDTSMLSDLTSYINSRENQQPK